jgi:parallel beta-helix repeat protein
VTVPAGKEANHIRIAQRADSEVGMQARQVLLALCFCVVVGLSRAADAATLTVGPDETYTTIQDAVTAANAGDTILVRAGTYVENVLIDNWAVPGDTTSGQQDRSGLVIQAEDGPEVTIIQSAATDQPVVSISAHGVQFTGFTATGAGWANAGIGLRAAADCTISGNRLVGNYYGITLGWAVTDGPGACGNVIQDNTCSAEEGDSIAIVNGSSNNLVSGNDLSGNGSGWTGIRLMSSCRGNRIEGNTIHDHKMGIYLDYNCDETTIADNTISSNLYGNLTLRESVGLVVVRNMIRDSEDGIHAYAVNDSYFYLNSFVNLEFYQSVMALSSNTWHSSAPLTYVYNGQEYTGYLGNHWDVHSSSDADGDGVLDEPFVIDVDSATDPYPLAEPHGAYELTQLPFVYNVDTGLSFTSIQAAIDDAETLAGHTLQVGPSTYVENVVVDKELTIVGDAAVGSVLVTGADPAAHVLDVVASNVSIRGMQATGASTAGYAGIHVAAAAENCHLVGNTCTGNDIGMLLDSALTHVVTGNRTVNNATLEFRASDESGGSVGDLRVGARATKVSFSFTGTIGLAGVGSVPPAASDQQSIGRYVNVAELGAGSQVEVNVYYTAADVYLVNEASLRLHRWDGAGWSQVAGGGVDVVENRVYGTIDAPGVIAPLGIRQVTAVWRRPDEGNWHCSGCWSTMTWPRNSGALHYAVHIDAGSYGNVVVHLTDGITAYIDNLTVDAGDVLDLNNGILGMDANGLGGLINNDGTIQLSSTHFGTHLRIFRDVLLAGDGELAMFAGGPNNISAGAENCRLTNGPGHTIRGSRSLGSNQLALTNEGLIDADNAGYPLEVNPLDTLVSYNTSVMQASNGGTLRLLPGTFDNTDGLIQALDGSVTQIAGAAVTYGELTTAGDGVIELRENGLAVDVLNAGRLRVPDGGGAGYLAGNITNQGLIELISTHFGTTLIISGDVLLAGSGALDIGNGGPNYVRGAAATDRLTNGPDHTIRGSRTLGNNQMTLTNAGLIDANDNDGVLTVDLTDTSTGYNTGVMQSSGGGTLRLAPGAFDNTDGLIQALDGSITQIAGAAVTHGELATVGDGVIELRENGVAADLTTTGVLRLPNGGGSGFLAGTITNEGLMELTSAGNSVSLMISGDVTLVGNGVLNIGNGGPNSVRGAAATDRLINGPDHTIRGSRALGSNQMTLTNTGLIDADDAGGVLTVDLTDTTIGYNTGVMQASSGGTLQLSTGHFDNSGGLVQALDGSAAAIINGAVLEGGLIDTAGSGRVNFGHNGLLADVTIAGYAQVPNGWGNGYVRGTIMNDGVLEVQGGGAGTVLRLDGDVTLAGSGELLIGGHNDINGSGVVLTNGPGHTIRSLSNNDVEPPILNHGCVDVPVGTVLKLNGGYQATADSLTTVDGTLQVAGTLNVAGVLGGAGTVQGALVASAGGLVTPGSSIGTLTVSGSYSQTSLAALVIEIDGPAAGSGYDRLAVTGAANLSGELHIVLPGTFVPTVGQQFTILTAGSRSGEFEAVLGPSQFGVTYGSNNVVLTLLAPLGDCDGDGVLDLEDFITLGNCLAGPDLPVAAECQCADQDGDGDVDLEDFRRMQLGYAGL